MFDSLAIRALAAHAYYGFKKDEKGSKEGSVKLEVYRGSNSKGGQLHIHSGRGVLYFTKDPAQADLYGRYVHKFELKLRKPFYTDDLGLVDQFNVNGRDLEELSEQGYDSVVYDSNWGHEKSQIIIFDSSQAKLVDSTPFTWDEITTLERAYKKASISIRREANLASRTACIIAVGDWDGHRCLFKNRDRNYTPEVKLYHEMLGGTEVLYMKDELTGWCEGMNEYGIGIVNAALAVGMDEKEKDIAKGNKGGKPTKNTLRDGERVLKSLECTDLVEAVEVLQTHKDGLRGHSFISGPEAVYSLEATWRGHDYHKRKLPSSRKHVRTNHGQFHTDAGYTEDDGDSYLSSLARRDQAMKVLRTVEEVSNIAPSIYGKRKGDDGDPLNMLKKTEGMRTTTQVVFDLSDLLMRLYLIPGEVDYKGYVNNLPKGYKPKISLQVFEYTDLDDDGGFDVVRRKKVAGSKFKNKKEVPRQDGKGTSTIYEYSDSHLKGRAKGKAKKVNHLMSQMGKIRAKAKKDLKSDNPKVRLPALAVLLMDHTYERVGNKGSADEGHYGVTTWKKKHLTFSGGNAILTYTGKSGVDHKKKITDKLLVRELRTQAFDKGKDAYLFHDNSAECCIEAKDVNAYLKQYKITAKDIRGYHANRIVREALEALTPASDPDKKSQEKARKEQFKTVIEEAAEEVGHEAPTLRTQYLAPSLEKDFIDDGKVNKSVSAMQKTSQTQLSDLLNSVQAWADTIELHHDTLNALIKAAEARRLGRIGQIRIGRYSYTAERIEGVVTGSQGVDYNTRITIQPRRGHHCTCPDWQRNGRRVGPCKHVLALAGHARADTLNFHITRLQGQIDQLEDIMVGIIEHADF